MKFVCKEIKISDDELGCQISFSDKKDEGYIENQSYEDILKSLGEYVTIQLSYGEDEFEKDYCTIEFSDFGKSGEFEDFEISLAPTLFRMDYKGEEINLQLDPDELTFSRMKDILRRIATGRGVLRINE